MGLSEEIELIRLLEENGMNCVHRLKQSTISDFIKQGPQPTSSQTKYWLDKNTSLPRKTHTYEVDVFAWKPGHWGALSIEEKAMSGTPKTIAFNNSGMTMHTDESVYEKSAEDLFLQCCGAGYLGKAYSVANNIDSMVLPVGVVDYNIDLFDTSSKWAFYNGVMFVRKDHFEWFVQDFLEDRSWIKDLMMNGMYNNN